MASVSRDNVTGLGARLRAARIACGMTQTDLAGSEYSVGYISRIETGGRTPGRNALETLSARVGVSAQFLLTGIDRDRALEQRHALDLAELALAGGDVDAALLAATALLDSGPLEPSVRNRARLVHALGHEASGDLSSAILELEDLEPSAAVGIALSRCYRETGELSKAIEVGEGVLAGLTELGLAGTTEYVRLAVTVAAAHFESGAVGVATRMTQRAIQAAETLASPEAQAAAYWNASIIERHAGNIEGAVRTAARALALLENDDSTRNLARLRTQLAQFHLRRDRPDLKAARSLLKHAANELRWSSASPVDVARNQLGYARLHLLGGDPEAARSALAEVPLAVNEQDAQLAAEVRVLDILALLALGEPFEAAHDDVASLLSLLNGDRGVAQLWFELGEGLAAAGDLERAASAYREASRGFGAGQVLLPVLNAPAHRILS